MNLRLNKKLRQQKVIVTLISWPETEKRRAIRLPRIYAEVDLTLYARIATQEINDDELRTYQEAITSQNKLHWKKTIDEE